MPLKFPLSAYDEAGRLKPPLFLLIGVAFCCRGLIILVVALSMRSQSEEIMRVFYPSQREFYLSLIPAFLAFLSVLMIGKRQQLWKNKQHRLFYLLLPLIFLMLLSDIALQLYILDQFNYVFALNKALSLTFSAVFFVYLLNHPQIVAMARDWVKKE